VDVSLARSPATQADGGAHWYAMYGLRIVSERPLPFLPAAAPPDREAPGCTFRWASPEARPPQPDGPVVSTLVCHEPCHNGRPVLRVYRGPGGTWFWHRDTATLHVRPDAREVTVYPEPHGEEQVVALSLVGRVATFVLHQLGYPSLHASAVVTPAGAAVFLGPPGQGKSTIAASFMRQGAALLTDDVLPLRAADDGVYAIPSLPMMKLWPQSAHQSLELTGPLPNLTAWYPKKLLTLDQRFRFAEAPARIRGIYVLDRFDPQRAERPPEATLRRLRGHEQLTALLAQMPSIRTCLTAREVADLLPLFARLLRQARCRVLSYPTGFRHQAAVRELVLADLAAR
jgi:hypothetical protein